MGVERTFEVIDQVMRAAIRKGQYRVVTLLEDPPVLIKVTARSDNDLVRYVKGECVLTGKEITHGMYTDDQIQRVGPPLNEMQVIAWVVAHGE